MTARVRLVSTTRAGGVSAPPYDTFNLAYHVDDDPAAVSATRARLAAAVGLPAAHVVWMHQVHGNDVEVVDAPREPSVGDIQDTDALVTAVPGLALAVLIRPWLGLPLLAVPAPLAALRPLPLGGLPLDGADLMLARKT